MNRRLAAPLALAAVACAAATAPRPPASEATREPTLHAVRSQRLVEVMRRLDRLAQQRLPTAIDERAVAAARGEEAAALAQALAEAAAEIARFADDELEPVPEREDFRTLASRLESQARALARDVGSLDAESRCARLAELRQTCSQCHARYRGEESCDDPFAES